MDCFLCLRTQEDLSTLTNYDEIITVHGCLSFNIIDLIYLATNIKLEVPGTTCSICKNCIKEGIQAFLFKQMCINVGQRQKKVLNPEADNLNIVIPPNNIPRSEIKVELIDTAETHITSPAPTSSENLNEYEEVEISDNDEEENETEDFEMLDIKPEFQSKHHHFGEHNDEKKELTPQEQKSQSRYEKFQAWRNQHNFDCSEEVLLNYLKELGTKLKPPSLWGIYSMLKATLKANDNLDITPFVKVTDFLKARNKFYQPTKASLTKEQINRFLTEAPDCNYLFNKVVVIFTIAGCCKIEELINVRVTDIEDLHTKFLVTVRNTKQQAIRTFVIPGIYYSLVRKYLDLRPANMPNNRFFINYRDEKCTRQVVGIHKMGTSTRKVAEFLKLPNPEIYFNRTLRFLGNASKKRNLVSNTLMSLTDNE